MRKVKRISFFVCFQLILGFGVVNANWVSGAESDNITLQIPESATLYVENNYKSIVQAVKSYSQNFQIDNEKFDHATLGNPYIVNDLDVEEQDEIYHYPVLDDVGEVLFTISAIGTSDGWTFSISKEMVNELNQINYQKSNYIFYESDNNIVAESSEEAVTLTGYENREIQSFQSLDFQEKEERINEKIKSLKETDLLDMDDTDVMEDGYSPSFSESTNTRYVCKLYNEQGQFYYNNCWAAAVATIVNYRKGTDVTAKQVCNKMNIDYDEGGSTGKAQLALQAYNVDYNNINLDSTNFMSWSSIVNNIKNKYPIYVSCKSADYGHAVTIYGYRTVSSVDYICIWNSGLDGGEGDIQLMEYKGTNPVFSYDNDSWICRFSLSYLG